MYGQCEEGRALRGYLGMVIMSVVTMVYVGVAKTSSHSTQIYDIWHEVLYESIVIYKP